MASKRLVPDTLEAMGMPSSVAPRANDEATELESLVKKITETLLASLSTAFESAITKTRESIEQEDLLDSPAITPQDLVHARESRKRAERRERLGLPADTPTDSPESEDAFADEAPELLPPRQKQVEELPSFEFTVGHYQEPQPARDKPSADKWDADWVDQVMGMPEIPKPAKPGHGSFKLDDELGDSNRAAERASEQYSTRQMVDDMQAMQDSIMRTEDSSKSLNFEMLRQLAIDNNNDDRRLRELMSAFQHSRNTLTDTNI